MTSPEEMPGESSTSFLAKALDIRSFVGMLFVVFGVIVSIVGLTASDADVAKAAGINISLWIGLIMLILGLIFIAWLLLRPPELLRGHEATDEDLPEQMRHHGH